MGRIYFRKTAQKLLFTNGPPLIVGYFLISLLALGRILTSDKVALILSILVAFAAWSIAKSKKLSILYKISPKRLSYWSVTIGLLISLYAVHRLFSNSSFVLSSFPDRTIGILVLNGLDANLRTFYYLLLIAAFTVFLILCIWLYSKLDMILTRYLKSKDFINERKILFILSLASNFTLIFHYLNGAELILNILDILLFLIFLDFLILLAKVFANRKNELFMGLLNRYDLIILSFLFPTVIFFTRWVLKDGSFIFNYKYFYVYFFLWLIFWCLIYLFIHIFRKIKGAIVTNELLLAAIPFLLIPISIPLSNELQFSLSGISTLSVRSISLITIGSLLATSFLLFIISAKRSAHLKIHFAPNFYLPIFIATLVLFNMHSNFIEIPNGFDMFHHGENLLSTQQLFSFDKIPFIDIYPTHGISYMVGQVLYSLVNGYRAFEPWLWEWMTKIFEILLLYFVLKKITNSFFATIVIVFLPFLGIFGGHHFTYGYNTYLSTTYYLAAFVGGLSLSSLMKDPNYRRLVFHWIICFFLLAWRVDFGITAFASSLLTISVILLKNRLNRSKSSLRTIQVIKSLSIVSVLIAGLGAILSAPSAESFPKTLFQVFQFVKIQPLAQGLPNISGAISPIAIFQYFILPSIGVFYFVFFIFYSFKNPRTAFGTTRWLLLFLAIFSLIISVRSVQRQTLAVLGYNPYLFVFLGVCITFYLKRFRKEMSIIVFALLLMAYQFILPDNRILIKAGRLVNLITWENKESRVRVNDYQYQGLNTFLNSNLRPGQTFLDLTSTPMLYIATNKKFVDYFIPSAYHTSEPIQLFTLERVQRAFANEEIPIVIFRQPDPYANSIDGVPNEIRGYRIYEFIYRNYQPAGFVDGYMIWNSNNYRLIHTNRLVPIKTFTQDFDLKKLPYIWGTFDEKAAKDNTVVLSTLIKEPLIVKAGESIRLSLDNSLDKTSGNYVHFKIKSDELGSLELKYGKNPVSTVKMDLLGSGNPEDYLIRISSQWEWMSQNIKTIELTTTTEAELIEAYVRKGD